MDEWIVEPSIDLFVCQLALILAFVRLHKAPPIDLDHLLRTIIKFWYMKNKQNESKQKSHTRKTQNS